MAEPRRKARWAEILGAAAVGLALLLGIVPLQRALAPKTGTYHPWWEIPGLVLGALLLLFAVGLWLSSTSVWAWAVAAVPIKMQSPVVRRSPTAKAQPRQVDLGRLDYEELMMKGSASSGALLVKMGAEMERNASKLARPTRRISDAAGSSVSNRRRALSSAARVMNKHARRMEKLEADYRVEVDAFLGSAKRLVELAPPDEDFESLITSTAEMRAGAVTARDAMAGYQQTAQETRNLSMSQDSNAASEGLVAVLGLIVEDVDTVIAYCDWVADVHAKKAM